MRCRRSSELLRGRGSRVRGLLVRQYEGSNLTTVQGGVSGATIEGAFYGPSQVRQREMKRGGWKIV